MKQLIDIGLTAVRIGHDTNFRDVAAGKFRFGMHTSFVGRENAYKVYLYLYLVFLAPETAVSPTWREVFSTPVFKEKLAVVAVDEAHCISEWLGQVSLIPKLPLSFLSLKAQCI